MEWPCPACRIETFTVTHVISGYDLSEGTLEDQDYLLSSVRRVIRDRLTRAIVDLAGEITTEQDIITRSLILRGQVRIILRNGCRIPRN